MGVLGLRAYAVPSRSCEGGNLTLSSEPLGHSPNGVGRRPFLVTVAPPSCISGARSLSAILEALKRIEREPQQTGLQSLPQHLDPVKRLERRLRKRWFKRRMIGLSLILPILGVGAWAVIQYKPWVKSGSNVPAVHTPSDVTKTRPTVVASKGGGDRRSSFSSTESRPRRLEPPRPTTREELGSLPRGDPFPKSSLKEILPEKQEARSAIDATGGTALFPGDSGFKLDALVWSSNPKSRFAVINGQIVRAGETIRGAAITTIERDHVGLRSGSRSWELRLNIQSRSP